MSDIHGMMQNPLTYVILFVVLVALVALVLVAVRVAGAQAKKGGDPRDDRHLG